MVFNKNITLTPTKQWAILALILLALIANQGLGVGTEGQNFITDVLTDAGIDRTVSNPTQLVLFALIAISILIFTFKGNSARLT